MITVTCYCKCGNGVQHTVETIEEAHALISSDSVTICEECLYIDEAAEINFAERAYSATHNMTEEYVALHEHPRNCHCPLCEYDGE